MTEVQRVALTAVADKRGHLAAGQYPESLPFLPVRVFIVTKSPAGTQRGGHAHRVCHQVLIATAGVVHVEYDDDEGTHMVSLHDASEGLHVPPLAWARQTYVTEGSSLVVLASHAYDAADYIDDRDEAACLRRSAKGTRPA